MHDRRNSINVITGAVIIGGGLLVIICIVAFAVIKGMEQPNLYYFERQSTGRRLYGEISAHDLDGAYPETAEEVIELNNLLRRMLYGKIVQDEKHLRELLETQRELFADSLLEENDIDDQWISYVENTDVLYNQNVYLFDTTIGVAFYSAETNTCTVPITETMVNHDPIYWNYFLEKDDSGRWKIFRWVRTDKYFRQEIID